MPSQEKMIMTTSERPTTAATRAALSVPEIKSADFSQNCNGPVRGTAFDGVSGVEFDVRQEADGWLVNDDDGHKFRADQLVDALTAAVRGQVPGGGDPA